MIKLNYSYLRNVFLLLVPLLFLFLLLFAFLLFLKLALILFPAFVSHYVTPFRLPFNVSPPAVRPDRLFRDCLSLFCRSPTEYRAAHIYINMAYRAVNVNKINELIVL
jgi:hypothetical protein